MLLLSNSDITCQLFLKLVAIDSITDLCLFCWQKLLQMWIKYQSMEDKDRDKFLDSVWAIAKISSSTDQVNQLVTGLVKKVRVVQTAKSCLSVCNVLYNIIMVKLVERASVFT